MAKMEFFNSTLSGIALFFVEFTLILDLAILFYISIIKLKDNK